MNDKKAFQLNAHLSFDNKSFSNIFQFTAIQKINGDIRLVKNPFFTIIETESGGSIECFCIPSLGSPYRRLIDFGLNGSAAREYLNNYLKEVFDWFKD